MSELVKHRILQLLQDESQFNTNDVLVNIDHASVLPFHSTELQIDQRLRSILSVAKKTDKDLGIYPLCVTHGLIEWEYKKTVVSSPLILSPCRAVVNKINNSVRIEFSDDHFFINPFVQNRIEREFEIQLPEIKDIQELTEFLERKGFSITMENPSFIGNFHHHRFEIIKELAELSGLSFSEPLRQLLGDEVKTDLNSINLGNDLLFPADNDQLEVFNAIEKDHLVVQGPPGTGKSQVLTNLIGKILLKSDSAMIISEKRVALEVIQKKLEQVGLGELGFIATSETSTGDVLTALKSRWKKLENTDLKIQKTNLHLSEQYLDQLEQQLEILKKENIIGQISYSFFKQLVTDKELDHVPFVSDMPEMIDWIKHKEIIQNLFKEELHLIVGHINYGLLHQDFFKQFDKTIEQLLDNLKKIRKHFIIVTWIDLQNAMKVAALCQNFNSPAFRKHEAILTPKSTQQKKFLQLRKKYLQLHFIQSNFDLEKALWKKLPSLIETETLLELSKNASLFGKWKFRKVWTDYTDIPILKAEEILHKWKQYLVNSDHISQVKVDFCEIGIDDVNTELELIYQQIQHFTEEERNEWLKIPLEHRKIFADYNSILNQFYTQLKTNFRLEDESNLNEILDKLSANFPKIVQNHSAIKELPEVIHRNLRHFLDFETYELSVFKSNWIKFTAQFPSFTKFQPNDLLDKCHTISTCRDDESIQLSEHIRRVQLETFQYYHQLLQTSSVKLKGSEKDLRTRLKKGKALLVKEFSKSRNHPSLRELFSSEAAEWLRLFMPVWLSNPTQIAKCFPMQQNLFDFAIFDEASQIPLQNALGTIQRSNRILVSGDQQQMGPGNYFKARSGETVDLLHQAGFYWKNVGLKHHYRSEHPDLIRFSNKYFYKNELLAYPSVKQEKDPITVHFCEKGVFDERKNHFEAYEIARFIDKHIDSNEVLGIVAFSELQLAEIYECLSKSTKLKLEDKLDEDLIFFKALENVQGEECDHLIISLGYGKNENGEFHMRFGPLNTKNGTKRLNVLLTRARKKIDFFTSVKAEEFKLSSNEAVNLLRMFLLQEENKNETTVNSFPMDLKPVFEGNKVKFEHIYEKIRNAEELINLVQIMEKRGWKVELVS